MVVETFRNGDAVSVDRRLRDRGRLADWLIYVASWVDDTLEWCYQLMETDDRSLLGEWIANWGDSVDVDVHPVISSEAAAERIVPPRREWNGTGQASCKGEPGRCRTKPPGGVSRPPDSEAHRELRADCTRLAVGVSVSREDCFG